MTDPMLPLPGLSPVSGKKIMARFDGGLWYSDGGVPMLRGVESRLRVADFGGFEVGRAAGRARARSTATPAFRAQPAFPSSRLVLRVIQIEDTVF